MTSLIFSLLMNFAGTAPTLTAQVQPCVWPNPCGRGEIVVVAKAPAMQAAGIVETCVWPRCRA